MAGGPGGKEVGRVSIKIVPDSSDFIGEVRRLVREAEGQKVTIGVELDAGAARAQLKSLTSDLGNENVSLNVDADTAAARAETLQTESFIDGRNAKLNVGANTTKAMAEVDLATARINAKDATITVHVRVDDAGLGGIGDGKSGLFGAIGNVLSGIPTLAAGAASALSGFGGAAVTAFNNAASGSTGMLASFGSIIPVVGQAVAALSQFALMAGLYTVVAGAITAAVGAVGSALSALPALAFGGAGAIGVLAIAFSNFGDALGRGKTGAELEKQNKALAALPPPAREAAQAINGPLLTAFDALRTKLQFSFFQGFADQIRDLATRVMPALTVSLQGVASSLGAMVLGLASVAFSSAGIINLNTAFQGMSQLLTIITPSMQGLVQVLLQAAGTRQVWQLLGEIISVVIGRVTELFAQFSAGGGASLMVESLTQLKGVLDSAAGAFVTLIVQATNFFTGAGPGLRSLFDSINRTLQEIDFRGLGVAFGTFADAVGRFIDAVPPSVWQGIADAVQRLALKFQELSNDPAMQQLFTSLIGAIPIVIDGFTMVLGVVQTFAGFIRGLSSTILGFLETIGLVAPGTQAAFDGATTAAAGAAGPMGAAAGGVGRAAQQGVLDNMQNISPETRAALQRGIDAANAQAPPMGAAGDAVGKAAQQGVLDNMQNISPDTRAALQRGIDAANAQAPPMGAAGTGVGTAGADGVRSGIAPLPGHVGDSVADGRGRAAGEEGGYRSTGDGLASGLADGIARGASKVIGAAIGIARAAWQAAKSFLGIASPSKLFSDDVGAFIPAGMAEGITGNVGVVIGSLQNLATEILRANGITTAAFTVGQSIGEQVSRGITTSLRSSTASSGLAAAARELLSRIQSGGQIFEDLSFKGMSANLAQFNDQLGDMFYDLNHGRYGDMNQLTGFLQGVATAPVAAPAAASPGGSPEALALLDRLERGLKLDTESGEVIAKLAAAGQRSLDRR